MFFNNKILQNCFFILVLIITSCKYNEQENRPEQSEKIIVKPTQKKQVLIDEYGIYIVNKNWNQKKLDSLKISNPEVKVFNQHKQFVFITNSADSILISFNNINRQNPIIIFDCLDGPILTSLNRLHIFIDYVKDGTSKKDSEITSETFYSKTDTTKKREIDTIDIESLKIAIKKNKKLQIPKTIDTLPEQIILECSKSYPLISTKRNVEIHFDNDFWDYTDYYYTNGIRIGVTHPLFAQSPLSYLLVSNATNGIDYYGAHLVQHMYTGSKPKVDTTIPGDRPWAAYTVIGQYATSFDWKKKIKHESEINIGILGPKSGGGFLQDLVHTLLPNNSPPAGWDNQIKTDIIIDYQYKISKALYESKLFESYIKASVQVGTLRDNIKWGLGAKYGLFTPFYKNFQNLYYDKGKKKVLFSVFGDIETQLIGYDATLQGGVTDRTSVYVIPTRNMERFVIQGYIGIELSYKYLQLQFIQYWKSKEFKTGRDHKFVSARLFIGF